MRYRLTVPDILLLTLECLCILTISSGRPSTYYAQPGLVRRDRSLNWATLINNEGNAGSNARDPQPSTNPELYVRNPYETKQNTRVYTPPLAYSSKQIISGSESSPIQYEYVNKENGHPYYRIDDSTVTNGVNSQVPSNQFQKRALDLLYHKFVEPRIHKDIEPRPSLIEDLLKTFDNHVKKDIAAWDNSSRKPGNSYRNVVPSESQTNYKVVMPSKETVHTKASPEKGPSISSVAHVEEGETDDTFVVTDDAGVTHLITVDEIINSLAQMDENEITELLIGNSVVPNTERVDVIPNPIFQNSPQSVNLPSLLSKDIQYSRKGSDDNDIVLVKSADGDTRLVTVKDLKAEEEKKYKKLEIFSENVPLNQIKSVTEDAGKNNKATSSSKQAPFITIEDLGLQNSQGPNNLPKQETNSPKKIFNLQAQTVFQEEAPQNNHQKANKNSNTRATKPDEFDSIRESLLQVRQQHQQQEDMRNPHQHKQQNTHSLPPKIDNPPISFPFPAAPLHPIVAPNSPPLKVINTDASIMEFLPYRNTVSIAKNSPPVIQKTGIRNRLSKFFSRLIGKSQKGVTESETEEDQFVQIVMPRSDSNAMEQITIPLPKPIHFRGRHIQPSNTAQKRSDGTVTPNAQRRSSSIHFSSSRNKDKAKRQISNKDRQDMKLGTRTAALILKTSKIPDSVRENILSQINGKPEEFVLPSERHTKNNSPADRSRIDRIFEVVNKGKKKEIEFPTSYVYEIPPPFEYHEQQHYYTPHPSHDEEYLEKQKEKNKKKKKHNDDDYKPPLVDVNLLADIVYLSKFGDDNESFAFPKVGDSSRFVDVRRHFYT